MRTRSLAFAFVAAFAPLATPLSPLAFAQVANDYRVVPGERVGNLRLGMSAADVLETLGTPSRSMGDAHGNVRYHFAQMDVIIVQNRVSSIGVSDPSYTLESGVRVGSHDIEVRAAYGQPRRVEIILEDRVLIYRGPLMVSEDSSGIVTGFRISSH